jgi:ATP-dependent Clp protease, protease subunit
MTNEYKINTIGNSIYFSGEIDQCSSHEFVLSLHHLGYDVQSKIDKSINLYLNSDGGRTSAGFRMYEALKLFPGEVTCYCEGFVASAATVVMCGANKILTTPYTTFLIHQLSAEFDDKHSANKATVGWHDTLMQYVLDVYSKKTGEKFTESMLKEEVYLTAQQAKDLGFVEEILLY